MPQTNEMTLEFVYTAQDKQQMAPVIASVIEGIRPTEGYRQPVSKDNGVTVSAVLDTKTSLPLHAAFKSVQQIVSAENDVVLTTLSTPFGNEVRLVHRNAIEQKALAL